KGLGEGWSDFYALALLSQATDDINGNYAMAAYSYRDRNPGGATLAENYYYGGRRYPYTTDMTKNPLRFSDIDNGNTNVYSAARSPILPVDPLNGLDPYPSEEHKEGEVWCVTLWEARANLITKYGFATGNQLILKLVT